MRFYVVTMWRNEIFNRECMHLLLPSFKMPLLQFSTVSSFHVVGGAHKRQINGQKESRRG